MARRRYQSPVKRHAQPAHHRPNQASERCRNQADLLFLLVDCIAASIQVMCVSTKFKVIAEPLARPFKCLTRHFERLKVIKKLNKISRFGSYSNFTWPDDLPEFATVNIFYGRNYSGKTTLSRIFRCIEGQALDRPIGSAAFELELSDKTSITEETLTSTLCLRVFNQDYVRENLRFISDSPAGVTPFAILGADNAKLKQQIDEIEKIIGLENDDQSTGLCKELRDIRSSASIAATEAKNERDSLDNLLVDKATDRNTGIKYQSDRYGDQNYNKNTLKRELTEVLKVDYWPLEPTEIRKLETLLDQKQLPQLGKFKADIPDLFEFHTNVMELVSRPVGGTDKLAALVEDIALNQWVQRGLGHHDGPGEKCKFCDELITSERWGALSRHFDEESQRLADGIDKLIGWAVSAKDAANRIRLTPAVSIYSKFRDDYVELEQRFDSWRSNWNSAMADSVAALHQRKNQLHVPFTIADLDKSICNASDMQDQINKIIDCSNSYADEIASEQNSAKNRLRLNEVFHFGKTIEYSRRLKDIQELEERESALSTRAKAVQDRVESLRAQVLALQDSMSDQGLGAKAINDYLQHSLGHRELSLKFVKEAGNSSKATRFEVCRNGVPAWHLSEGECSLIAFCYFIARLKDSTTANQKPIIWIDDPICSLDGNHIFYIFSLLDAEIAQAKTYSQLFVSTHNLEFLRYLRRLNATFVSKNGKECKVEHRWYLVSRSGGPSTLSCLPKTIKDFTTEYSHLFEKLVNATEVNLADNAGYSSLYGFGNELRKFLEIFLYYRYPDREFDLGVLQLFLGDNAKVSLVNRVVNEFSHMIGRVERGAGPIDIPELVSAAKCVLDTIRQDRAQYEAFMRSIDRVP